MFNKSKLNRVALAVALSVGMTASVMAQETASDIRGSITAQSGQTVSGATVTITDNRTGSTRVLTTNETGSFSLRGLQVGGPYTVTVTDELGSTKVENLFLKLGETTSLNVQLEPKENIETISVTGTITNSNYGATGPAANFDLAALEAAPAINRDLKDLIRIDPRVYIDEGFNDSVQCAGANSRFNSLTVDGIRTNDNFGLNSNGYPTVRIPFSYDSIAQVSVELAPFDVQYGGFTACNINAVTKSGGNEFHGGAFFDYTNDSLRGDKLEGEDINVGAFNERRYGFHVGGALIEDKLFFFTSYEKLEGSDLFDRGPAGSNAAVEVLGFSEAQYQEILDIARNLYNYEPGPLVSSLPVEDEKIMAKLDWNINEFHRASLVYNYNDGNTIRESDGDSDEFEYSNHYYDQSGEFESYVASLYSDWTDNFSTELRIGTSDFDANVIPLGGTEFGEVQIRTSNNGARATVYLGADDSRHANKLTYSNDTFKLAGTYLLGDHVITGGYEYENLDVFNLFVQEAEGEYRFDSIEDFRNGTPERIIYESAAGTNDPTDGAAEFSYQIHTAYIQDEYYHIDWDATFTFGIRYDWYTSDDYPIENPLIEETYGFSNVQNMDGKDLIQPRFGFNMMATDSLELRGGFGLYSGGNPNVWIGNNYQNNGIILKENQDRSGTSVFDMDFTGEGRPLYDIPQDLYDAVANGQGRNGGINVMDPNFDIPSEWKYALGLTYTTADDYVVMADVLYTDKKDAAIISDLSRERTGEPAPDGRPIYISANGRSEDFMLTNVKGDSGESTIFSVSLSKSHDFGLDWSLAYAYTESKEVSPMTSSVAFSNYFSPAVSDAENPGVSTSAYEIPHRFTLRMTYEREFFDGYATRFSVFGSANEGRPYSFVFDGDPGFGSTAGFISHNLVYIPEENDANVIYADGFDKAAFDAFVESQNLARGEIMAANSVNSDWWTKFDIKVEQEFPGFYEGHKGKAFLVIENFGNLLNDDWGVMYEASFPRQQAIVDASINDNGQYVFEEFITPALQTRVADASLWEIRVGVKYSF
ncbi:TonB-dependent receptor [Bowmanella dokdonensis]|uniref:TonB-dependent receptor n=1 Tax=Bowmanella dokdonensis TaxID=751969 RepID=A0A939IP45_9ALTE|nr:TonB-dependent receptor [Bowmanella dokdonensis]MBN7825510.1 TonB-dependent receptor [Bowmanella dokdonensis]